MALRVGFDATAAARQRAGIGRYTRELLAALDARSDPHRYRLYYCSKGARGSLPALGWRFNVRALPVSDRVLNAIWHRARAPLPIELALGRLDLFHSPDFTAPPVVRTPVVITIHDLAFIRRPECAYPTLRHYLQRVVPRSVRRADHLIAVSESTRRDILELFDVPPERVTTIYEGVAPSVRPCGCDGPLRKTIERLGVRGPYILSVGTLEPRKNYPRLLEAYAMLRRRGITQRLVIAGARGWLYAPIFECLRSLGLDRHVTFIEPNDVELRALYGAADAFVYPSLYEGFGIPPLEALAAGVPVACSNVSSLPEVVGDAALTFDPNDPAAIAAAMERLLSDMALARALREIGPRQAARFDWCRTAAETVAIYERVAGGA